jgi:Glutamyl- and glutaminyl-tRNA synthetases
LHADHRRAPRGRFAPTPSGPLHLGSLYVALASWLSARSQGGRWLLRIDDLDPERCDRRHTDRILQQLERHGLHWDESPWLQSEHRDEHAALLAQLEGSETLYGCTCTRALLRRIAPPGPDGRVYPGHCRGQPPTAGAALRLSLPDQRWRLDDPLRGPIERDLRREVGDPVLRRADGVPGYLLACVADDLALAVDEIVRGDDLCGSSLLQHWLLSRLGHRPPRYLHLPVLTDPSGRKLSKQNHADAVDEGRAAANLAHCLALLGQADIADAARRPATEVLEIALARWQPDRLPGGPEAAGTIGRPRPHLS